jgi:hypothetical protein
MSNIIISTIGYIQGVFKVFIMIHVGSLGALDCQVSDIECSFINILKNHDQLP